MWPVECGTPHPKSSRGLDSEDRGDLVVGLKGNDGV